MGINRIAKYSGSPADGDGDGSSQLPGFAMNPLAASMSDWQRQIYQAAFEQAQRELEKEQGSPDDWCI